MPNGMNDLRDFLALWSAEDRAQLAGIIGASLGNSPSLICDHLNYLRHGAVGQAIALQSYKQLVTDVADKLKIDWPSVLGGQTWSELETSKIEAAIVAVSGLTVATGLSKESHLKVPRPILVAGVKALVGTVPGLGIGNEVIAEAFGVLFDHFSTEWASLYSAVVFIHAIRKRNAPAKAHCETD